MKIRVNEVHSSFKTARIGSQTWMAENLSVDDGGEGIYHRNGQTYYTWEAARRVADKIPNWHLPSARELGDLDLVKAEELKSTKGWKVDSWKNELFNGNNNSGFNAEPVGFIDEFGNFVSEGKDVIYWSNTEYQEGKTALGLNLTYSDNDIVQTLPFKINWAVSVRLVSN